MEDENANGLIAQHRQDLAKVVDEDRNLGDLIKPLVREIHLFDSFIAGTTHLADDAVLSDISEGEKLMLRREVNKFDENAILILKRTAESSVTCPKRITSCLRV